MEEMPSRGFLFLDVNDPLAERLNSLAVMEEEMPSRGFLTRF
jgi:hypothetical protein